MHQKFLYIETWGCQMNEYDSKKMAEILKGSHNLKLTDKPELADVLLMNTCSVRDKARAKVLSKLGEWRKIKSKSKAIIGLGGCVASMDGAEIKQKMPFVDIVFGPQTLHRLPTLIETAKKDKKLAIDLSFPAIEKFDNLPKPESNGPTAYISIMEGCSKYCKFCIVPYTRGEEVSRGFESILIEALQLAEQGVSEITLLGQNVNAYKSLMPNGKQADLGTLINYIAEIDKIKRIRFTTSHPKEFHQGLIEAYASTHKLVNHLHLPVQSGSNRVLNHMGRGYTAQDFLKKLDALKMIRPDITITSDFIVGYPGESEAEFEETLNLVDTVKFDQSFSFIYSPRPGTPAAFLPDKTPMEEKKSRLHRLQSRLKKYADEYSLNMVGKNFPILVTGSDKKNKGLAGRTENNRVVNFLSKDKSLIGKIINVNVTEKLENSLIGEIT